MIVTLSAISLTTPAMLLGAAAVALPIAAHLLSRRARQRVVFPSVTLLAEASAGQSRLFRLRRWILLALRCLAIVLLAWAFARPVWVEQTASGETAGDRQAVVVVVDVSASTAQRGDGVSLFSRVQAAAIAALDDVRAGRDVVNLVTADAQPTAAFPELIVNPALLRSDIEQLQPTAERAELGAAIELAANMLREANAQRRLVVVSDMQATNWEDVAAAALSPGSAERPIDLTLVGVGGSEPAAGNVALAAPRADPPAAVAGRPVEFSVEVTNYSVAARSVTVRLDVQGRRRGSETVTLEPWEARRVSFEPITPDEAEHHRVTFSIDDDELAADNRAYLVAPARQRMSVALVAEGDATDTDREPYYLQRALSPRGDETDLVDVQLVEPRSLGDAALSRHEVVVLSDVGPLDAETLAALVDFVEGGGGLLVTSSGQAVLDRFDAMGALRPWDVAGPAERGDDDAWRLGDGAWTGEVLDVFDALGRDALSRAAFERVFAIEQVNERAQVLLRFDDGTPALARMDAGEGRIVAANFGAGPAESDLAARGIFVPFVHVLVQAAMPSEGRAARYTVGDVLTPTTTADEPGVVVRDSQGDAVERRVRQPGFYTLEASDGSSEVVAVNLDPRESDLRATSAERLRERATMTDAAGEPRIVDADTGELRLGGRPLWPYFLLAALAMLGLELGMLIAWRR